MISPIAFMFSGQGSQYFHIGRELFKNIPVFQSQMLELDSIISEIRGTSILDFIYDNKRCEEAYFNNIYYTHPAIFMVQFSLAQTLLSQDIFPEYVLGSSLGEFSAAAVAGVLSAREALICIMKHEEYIEKYCDKALMTSVLHDPAIYYDKSIINENSELAAINSPMHFVISGSIEKMSIVHNFLKENKIIYQPLPVCYAFHSSHIDKIAPYYVNFLKTINFKNPVIKFASCATGDIISEIPSDHFWEATRKTICFPQALQAIDKNNDCVYLDLGPGDALANFVRRNLGKKAKCHSIMSSSNGELQNYKKFLRSIALSQ